MPGLVELEVVQCPNCKIEVGISMQAENLLLFKVGALIVREMKANCAECGHAFYFSISDREMKKFLQAVVTPPPPPDPPKQAE